jgi:hypothetical protein
MGREAQVVPSSRRKQCLSAIAKHCNLLSRPRQGHTRPSTTDAHPFNHRSTVAKNATSSTIGFAT